MPEILAILEQNAGSPLEQSAELLAELSEIASRQQTPAQISAVLLISPTIAEIDTTLLARMGVQNLYLLQHPRLEYYTSEAYIAALAWFIQQRSPMLIATSATANGRDWAPRLAARLRLPFVPGCLSLDLRDAALFSLHSIYEGRAYIQTTTALHDRPALATFMPGVRGLPPRLDLATRTSTSPTVTTLTPEIAASSGQIRHLGVQAPSPEDVELEEAEKIVAGGRGIGHEGFASLVAFARQVGAAVGATRIATDQGWAEHARQIGATGKNVRPRLYIACGISGAAQHTSGIREAQTIVAINPDRNAPIFALADIGLLGDANQILPLATRIIERTSQT